MGWHFFILNENVALQLDLEQSEASLPTSHTTILTLTHGENGSFFPLTVIRKATSKVFTPSPHIVPAFTQLDYSMANNTE